MEALPIGSTRPCIQKDTEGWVLPQVCSFSADGETIYEEKEVSEMMDNELSQNELDEIAEFQQYKYDTQLLLEGEDLDDIEIRDYISEHFEGNELLVVGDEELIKLHFHTNEPWLVLAYCDTLGDVYDVVIENMFRQAKGLQG